jgi:hypothetical protein
MEFSIEIALPSGKTVRVRELKNSEYLSIIKYAQNKDFEDKADGYLDFSETNPFGEVT